MIAQVAVMSMKMLANASPLMPADFYRTRKLELRIRSGIFSHGLNCYPTRLSVM